MLLSQRLETFSQLSKLQGQGHWKIGSGESVTWLVNNCDVKAELLPLRYIFMWQKIYVWYHNWNHNKTSSKCFACIAFKNIDVHTLDEFAGIYKANWFEKKV